MRTTVEWLDISEFIASNRQPIAMFNRRESGGHKFIVPVSPLLQPVIDWSMTDKGDMVRVPMFGYDAPQKARSSILVTGVELGIAAASQLPKAHGNPAHCVLFVHTQVDEVGSVFRCYAGLAFCIEVKKPSVVPHKE